MKQNLDLDNQSALASVNQVSQAIKALYQQLQQVKIALRTSRAHWAADGARAPSTSRRQHGKLYGIGGRLRDQFGGRGFDGYGRAWHCGAAGFQQQRKRWRRQSSTPASCRRTISALPTYSRPEVLLNTTHSDPSLCRVLDQLWRPAVLHRAISTRGWAALARRWRRAIQRAIMGTAQGNYQVSRPKCYQGAVGNAAFDNILDRWNFSGGGLQARGFSGDSYDRLGALRQGAVASAQSNLAQTRFAIGSSLLYGAGQVANTYAQYAASGQQNPLGFANAYGSIAGGVAGAFAAGLSSAGAGAAAGSIVPGIGTLAGAAIGSIIGGGLSSAAISPFVATRETQKIGAVTSVQLGIGSNSFAGATHEASAQINEGFASNNGTLNGLKDRFLRFSHLYSGSDVVSQQDVAQTFSSLYSANLANGTALSFSELRGAGQRFVQRYGQDSADIAQRLAPALSKARANGNNLADLVGAAGLDLTLLFARDRNDNTGADALARGYGRTLDAQYGFEGAQSIAQGAGYDYAASSLGGRSFRQRGGRFFLGTIGS